MGRCAVGAPALPGSGLTSRPGSAQGEAEVCEQCQGEGAAPCMFCGGMGTMPSEGKGKGATCYACKGRGATICTTCRGSGYKRMG